MNKSLIIVICILLFPHLLYTQNTDSLPVIWQDANLKTEIRYQAVKKYLLSEEPQDSLQISV